MIYARYSHPIMIGQHVTYWGAASYQTLILRAVIVHIMQNEVLLQMIAATTQLVESTVGKWRSIQLRSGWDRWCTERSRHCTCEVSVISNANREAIIFPAVPCQGVVAGAEGLLGCPSILHFP